MGQAKLLVKPIRVLKARPHAGHVRPGTAVEVEEAQALRAACFLCLVSAACAPLVFLLRHVTDGPGQGARVNVNVQVLQRRLEAVFKAFLLPSN